MLNGVNIGLQQLVFVALHESDYFGLLLQPSHYLKYPAAPPQPRELISSSVKTEINGTGAF